MVSGPNVMRRGLAPIFRWGIGSSPTISSISPSNEDFPEGGESAASAPQATRLKSGVNMMRAIGISINPHLQMGDPEQPDTPSS